MLTLNTAAKISIGIGITGAALTILKVSNPVSILKLAVASQALAWMPDFVARCLRTLGPPSPPNLSSLPNEVLTYIQASLDPRDAASLSSADWAQYQAADPLGAAIYRFDAARIVTLEELRDIRAFNPSFSRPEKKFKLNLSNSNITDSELEDIIGHFPSITEITAQDCQSLTYAGLQHLTGLAYLAKLDLSRTNSITDDSLQILGGLENLKKLRMHMCIHVTDAGLQHLAGLQNLTTLDMGGCFRITDAGLLHLAELSNLRCLDLMGCRLITDAGLAHLVGLTHLIALNLAGCYRIGDAGLTHLAGMTHLERLDLYSCYKITDVGLRYLEGMDNLIALDLRRCTLITGDALQRLQVGEGLIIIR